MLRYRDKKKWGLSRERHGFHMVSQSPWPILAGLSAIGLTVGLVMYMHRIEEGWYVFKYSLWTVLGIATCWWRDVIREGSFMGDHTVVVQRGLRYGMILFIISEIMFFFAFFWGFFHSSLAPTIELGAIWPPVGIIVFDTWGVPLLNTMLLLLSGCTITFAHHALREGDWHDGYLGLEYTIYLAILFIYFQLIEYIESKFSMSDGIYGSTFYLTTGFHGLHVFIGSVFITVCFQRVDRMHMSRRHQVGVETAAWYWHFVDIVWLFLFVFVYWWGSLDV